MYEDSTALQPRHPSEIINHILLDKVCVKAVNVHTTLNVWPESWGPGSRYTRQ